MTDRIFHSTGVMPIAVNAMIEVSIFGLRTNLFGPPKLEPQIYTPMVRDLGTGVVYGRPWHYRNDNEDTVDDDLTFTPRSDLLLAERVVGRVRTTRVLFGKLPGMGTLAWVTSFVVTPDPSAYR